MNRETLNYILRETKRRLFRNLCLGGIAVCVLVFSGCANRGISVPATKMFKDGYVTLGQRNSAAAVIAQDMLRELREKPCVTEEERARINSYLAEYLVTEQDLTQMNDAAADFDEALKSAQGVK